MTMLKTMLENWAQTRGAETLGLSLLHFLWEGAVVALVLSAFLQIRASARIRYAASVIALAVMFASFCITLLWLAPQEHARAMVTRPLVFPAAASGAVELSGAKLAFWDRVGELAPWIAVLWMTGVVMFQLRALVNWAAAMRLSRTGVCRAEARWQRRVEELAERLRISRPVTLLESCLAEAPAVMGALRPVILVPIGALVNLPAAQIEAILIHELAHIRRHDYLVNLAQTFAESFLFFHPAVWWVSRVIRAEREHCCDDCVVAMTDDAHEYAAALAALEQSRSMAQEAVLAANGGNLTRRIRRLLKQPEGPRAGLAPLAATAAAVVLAGVVIAAHLPERPLAQAQAATPAAQSNPYQKWLDEDVVYIITAREREAFGRLTSDTERTHFIEQFWERRNPTPGSVDNPFKKEHYRRIAYADQRFGTTTGVPGWKTDRGRMYIVYGPPDEIEAHPAGSYTRRAELGGGQTNVYPFQEWRYRFIDTVGNNIIMEFVDRTGTHEYRMVSGPLEKEAQPYVAGQRGVVYSAANSAGAPVTVEVLPSRIIIVNIPLDFDAPEFSIDVQLQTTNKNLRNRTTAKVKLCKNAPGALGCLPQPAFRPEAFSQAPLEPGSYILSGTVGDAANSTRRAFNINFPVN